MKKLLLALLVIVVLVAGSAAAFTYYMVNRIQEPYKGFSEPEKFVEIPSGTGAAEIRRRLIESGVVSDELAFRAALMWTGQSRALKAGEYRFDRPMSVVEVVEKLARGDVYGHPITFPEGLTIREMAAIAESHGFGTADEFITATRDASLVNDLDPAAKDLEGYLFPDTYTFPVGATARAVVETMVRRFEQVWKPEWTARLDTLHMSRNDVMALAAIVEKEARLPQERPVIAAVYANRLRHGMLLQADPTVQYALGKHVARVYYKDLEVESPYNTYKHKGLPPGPIASPGRPSIEAALYPANVPYTFFVAFPDGHHEFRRDLAGHEQAKLEARRAWDSVDVVRRPDGSRSK